MSVEFLHRLDTFKSITFHVSGLKVGGFDLRQMFENVISRRIKSLKNVPEEREGELTVLCYPDYSV